MTSSLGRSAVVLAVLAATVLTACAQSGESGSRAELRQGSGPMDGIYQFEYDGSKRTRFGLLAPSTGAANAWWALRSHCSDAGCVATATRVDEDGSAMDQRAVLDFVDGKWVMVVKETGECPRGGVPIQMFGTWIMQPQPDGSLTGLFTDIRTGTDCDEGFQYVSQAPVTVRRRSDVPEDVPVDDPATVPTRKPTTAEGFRGTYTQTVAEGGGGAQLEISIREIMTYCVRNSDECVTTSTLSTDNTALLVFTFAGDRWHSEWEAAKTACSAGGTKAQLLVGEDILLPPELQGGLPIKNLSGSIRLESMQPCAGRQLRDVTYERVNAPPSVGSG